jgi:hypothetical protein
MAPLVTASVIDRILGNDGLARLDRRAAEPSIDRHELAKDASELLGLTVENAAADVEIHVRKGENEKGEARARIIGCRRSASPRDDLQVGVNRGASWVVAAREPRVVLRRDRPTRAPTRPHVTRAGQQFD